MIEEFKAALQEVARTTGRKGDAILAHITPEEEEYLEREFGGSTTNPVTGLKEYGGEPGAGQGGEGSTGGGGSGGGGSGGGGGGRGGGSDPGTGRGGGGPAGGTSEAASGRGRGSAGGASGGGRASRGEVRGGTSAPGSGLGLGRGGTGMSGAPSQSGVSANAVSRALSAMMSLGFGVPANPFSIADEEKDLLGVPGAVRDIAQAVGTGISAFGGPSANTIGEADPQAAGVTGISGPSGVPAGGGGDIEIGEPGPPSFDLARPAAMEAPAFLGLGDAMTPLQQRAKIATFGTGGESGGYRSDPAQEYYKNIFLRSVLGDEGQIAPNAQVLPVETQYARQTLGYDTAPEIDAESFARILSDLPSKEDAAAFIQAWIAANPQRESEQR